ncbi:MAG: OPT/YSL family transporter [Deltaproteobacteria bacterium]|nr:OPT/YSL family transporter [Deltaproteobacteria bacterium]
MSEAAPPPPPGDKEPSYPQKPPGVREFTLRAVIAGVVVAAIMGASYPYVVLKLGFGPNVSVVAAFFGYLFLGILFSSFNRWENNIVQTAGTSAAQTAFMCIILAAFDLITGDTANHQYYLFSPSIPVTFLWLTAASILGLLLAVPLRRHYIVDEKLTYADGVAAAETIVVLDARGEDARRAARALFLATLASAIAWFLTTKWSGEVLGLVGAELGGAVGEAARPVVVSLLPENVLPTFFGLTYATAGAGFAVSLLAIGSGMIVGNRINISMAAGALIAWVIGPHVLLEFDIIKQPNRGDVLKWMMWPGTGMLIAAGLTSLFLKWRTLVRTFTSLRSGAIDASEFPLKWVGVGVVLSTIALLAIQFAFFDVPFWAGLIAVALSLPLMLVGLRVLGETNWGPISQLTNMMQAAFAGLMPGSLTANLATSGTTGTIASQSEAIMQDYKAGHLIGSTPRYLTYSQLIAAPIGALAVALSYPAFKALYGVGGEDGLSAPASRRIANFSEFVVKGASALPPYALAFMGIGAVLGILIALGEINWRKYLPSATGLGIGMMVPGNVVFSMVIGGILLTIWERVNKQQADRLAMPLASGLIAGEALAAIIVPLIVALGLLHANPLP